MTSSEERPATRRRLEQASTYKVPKVYEFVEAIPLTSVGKVDKKAMRPNR